MGLQLFDQHYSVKKSHVAGTHRARSPQQTFEDFRRHMGPLGITRLANITGLDCVGIPVYMAIRPNSRGLSTAQGKGLDPVAAKVSALMECIEGWHGERVELPLRYESFRALRREAAVVDVTKLVTRPGATVHLDVPMLWVEGYDLLTRSRRWVPFESVTTNFVRAPGQETTFLPSTNGLASGNHLLEATLHGLCETVERDSIAEWELQTEDQLKAAQLDLSTLHDEACKTALTRLSAAQVDVCIWDATSKQLSIPTFVCWIFDGPTQSYWRPLGVFSGQGTHPSPEVALLRAITEAAQSRLTYISGTRDDVLRSQYDTQVEPANLERIRRLAHGIPPTRKLSDVIGAAAPSFEEDIEVVLSGLRRRGLEHAVVVNLTKPELGIPVVKVVVPGLRLAI